MQKFGSASDKLATGALSHRRLLIVLHDFGVARGAGLGVDGYNRKRRNQ